MLLGITPTMFNKAGGIPVGATGNDADCVLLLHGSGPNNSTVFTDYSIGRHGNAAVVGDAKVSTLISKFGNGAMYFDGTGDSINYPNSADWVFGSSNFTVECWFNRQGGFGSTQVLFGQGNASGSRTVEIDIGSDNKLSGLAFSGGSPVVNIPSLSVINTSGWHHVAFVRASSLFYLFVDGVLEGTASFAGTIDTSGSLLSIGKLGENTTGFNFFGLINEVRYSKVSRWTGNFTPPTQPYGPDPDFFTKLLLHMNGITGTTQFIDASMYLKGYATVGGAAQITAAQVMFGSGSLQCGGAAADCITYPNHADYDFGTGDFTIDFWAKVFNNGSYYGFFGKCNASGSNGLYYYVNNNNQLQLVWLPSDAALNSANSLINALTDTNWHHYAIVRSGTRMIQFKDGVNIAENTINAGASITANTNVMTIGRGGDFSGSLPFKGYIDEFRVSKGIARWTANFSVPAAAYPPPDPVITGGNDIYTKLLMHMEGSLLDSSLAAHGTATNAGASVISATQAKFGVNSFFNGNNGYCTFPHSADWEFGAGDFTIDWWEYRTAAGAVISRDLSSTYVPFLVLNPGTGNQIYMSSTGSSWDVCSGLAGPNIVSAWHHHAITRQGTAFKYFQNGSVVQSWTSSASLLANSNPLCIGAYANANNMGGYTDELRISKGIARWTANFTPPTAPYF